MVKVNRSLDSKVTCLRLQGIYILLLGLWILASLMILSICIKVSMPPILTMMILFVSTTLVVMRLVNASERGGILKKKSSSKRLNYYICKS